MSPLPRSGRLASLEASLGVRLLNRTPDGYVPTLAGQVVQEHAERLEAEAQSLEHTVGGRERAWPVLSASPAPKP